MEGAFLESNPENKGNIKKIKESVNRFLQQLLEKKVVEWVLTPYINPENPLPERRIITKPEEAIKADPLTPVIPGFPMSTFVSEITREKPISKPLAVLLKPCEAASLVELVKFRQANLDNLLTIGVDCYGSYHVLDFKKMVEEGEKPFERMINALKNNKGDELFRTACKTCLKPVAENTDLNIGIIGVNNLFIQANTSKGTETLKKIGLKIVENKERDQKIKELIEERGEKRKGMFKEFLKELHGLHKLNEFFEDCINCHNCMEVCPICFCKECFFESELHPYVYEKYIKFTIEEGTIQELEGKLQFHLGRLIHMSTSCVSCGLCEQACPQEIKLFKLCGPVSENVQKSFNYRAGEKLEETPPITTFYEEDLGLTEKQAE